MKPASNKSIPVALPVTLRSRAMQFTSVCIVAAALAACGGGTSGGTAEGGSNNDSTPFPISDLDRDGDGLLNSEEEALGLDPDLLDSDFDGILDGDEDTDGDGVDNLTEATNQTLPLVGATTPFPPSADDTDGDGLLNTEEEALGLDPDLLDSDFDGVLDGDEDFDGDGISNLDEAFDNTLLEGTDTTVVDACVDETSMNGDWSDNCVLRNGGVHGNSYYTVGVQRILFCGQFNAGNASTLSAFADGIFGPNTEQSVRDYQTARGISVDGVVGPETWGTLRGELNFIESLSTSLADAHSVTGCGDFVAQFYNNFDGLIDLGWTMASQPGELSTVPFSNAVPQGL